MSRSRTAGLAAALPLLVAGGICGLGGAGVPLVRAADAGPPDAPAGASSLLAPGAHNEVQNIFTREGYRSICLRGSTVKPVPPSGGGAVDRVDITEMTVIVFSGKADERVDSVLTSPQATFLLNERTAHGDGPVRLVRDDIDVRGEDWTYDHRLQKVTLEHRAHVVFPAALPDILK